MYLKKNQTSGFTQHSKKASHFLSAGFTLIEILTVIAIATLLLGIITSSISGARQSSRDGRRVADINQLRLALEQYYDACGQYPNQLLISVNSGCAGSTTFGNFIAAIPTDPSTGSSYPYFAAGTTACTKYHIGASLENSTNRALLNDADAAKDAIGTLCSGGGTDFAGLSAGATCGVTAGTAQPGGTETCFDATHSK